MPRRPARASMRAHILSARSRCRVWRPSRPRAPPQALERAGRHVPLARRGGHAAALHLPHGLRAQCVCFPCSLSPFARRRRCCAQQPKLLVALAPGGDPCTRPPWRAPPAGKGTAMQFDRSGLGRACRADPLTWTHPLPSNNTFIPRWRESSFLDNPRCPPGLRRDRLRVLVDKVRRAPMREGGRHLWLSRPETSHSSHVLGCDKVGRALVGDAFIHRPHSLPMCARVLSRCARTASPSCHRGAGSGPCRPRTPARVAAPAGSRSRGAEHVLACCRPDRAQARAPGSPPEERWTAQDGVALVLPPGLTDLEVQDALRPYRHIKIWWCAQSHTCPVQLIRSPPERARKGCASGRARACLRHRRRFADAEATFKVRWPGGGGRRGLCGHGRLHTVHTLACGRRTLDETGVGDGAAVGMVANACARAVDAL